jgi:hypothetical protein
MTAAFWICSPCLQAGHTIDSLVDKQAQDLTSKLPQALSHPSREQMRRDAEAAELHGRIVRTSSSMPNTDEHQDLFGVLHYLGRQVNRHSKYFVVRYHDGSTATLTLRQAKTILHKPDEKNWKRLTRNDATAISSRLLHTTAIDVSRDFIHSIQQQDPLTVHTTHFQDLASLMKEFDVGVSWGVNVIARLPADRSVAGLSQTCRVSHVSLPQAVSLNSYFNIITPTDVVVIDAPDLHAPIVYPLAWNHSRSFACIKMSDTAMDHLPNSVADWLMDSIQPGKGSLRVGATGTWAVLIKDQQDARILSLWDTNFVADKSR